MTTPLLHLLVTQPRLVAEHADAYAELIVEEISAASANYERRATLSAAQLCCFTGAATLAGVATMLWSIVPVPTTLSLWIWMGAPLIPLAAAWWCRVALKECSNSRPFGRVRDQLAEDLIMLREEGML